MSLTLYLRAIRRHWPIVLISLLSGGLILGFVAWHQPARYRSEVRLVLAFGTDGAAASPTAMPSADTTPSPTATPAVDRLAESRAHSYATRATESAQLRQVIARLHLPYSERDLADEVVASIPVDSTAIDIAVTDADPRRAADICTAVADEVTEFVDRDRERGSPGSPAVTVARPPSLPTHPIRRDWALYALAGVLGGFIFGAGLASLRSQLQARRETFPAWLVGLVIKTWEAVAAGVRLRKEHG